MERSKMNAQLLIDTANVALFSHEHLFRVIAAHWTGLSVEQSERLLLNTASISINPDPRSAPVPAGDTTL